MAAMKSLFPIKDVKSSVLMGAYCRRKLQEGKSVSIIRLYRACEGYDVSQYFVTFLHDIMKESEIYFVKYESKVPIYFRHCKAYKERIGHKFCDCAAMGIK
jgi:hypothetical protein